MVVLRVLKLPTTMDLLLLLLVSLALAPLVQAAPPEDRISILLLRLTMTYTELSEYLSS
jgi:hypothetical protein